MFGFLYDILIAGTGALAVLTVTENAKRVGLFIVRTSSQLLPPSSRDRFREQWEADLLDVTGDVMTLLSALGVLWRCLQRFGQRRVVYLAAWFDLLFIDYGILRSLFLNRHPLGASAWRCAQPSPNHISHFARIGVRTIINVRGARLSGSYWLEQKACKRYGIALKDFPIRCRSAPTKTELVGAKELLSSIEHSIVIHGKEGADRAGLMSALYLHVVEGMPIAEVQDQLSLRFGHIRQSDVGILDHFFECYLTDSQKHPIDFFEWVETVYDPSAVQLSFRRPVPVGQKLKRSIRKASTSARRIL